MQVHNLSEHPSLLNNFIAELRDQKIQKDRQRFRRNIERVGEILGYELSKTLNYCEKSVETPLGTSTEQIIKDDVVLCSILRAGVTLHNGLLNYFDNADNAFISAYRQHHENPESFNIIVEYLACPDLNNKTLILADPMLATGRSMIETYEALTQFGTPKDIHLVSVIGAQHGVDHVSKFFGDKARLWIATIDKELNEKGYIIPGLGDAGDLAFGSKLQN
ncbi:MAG: uracil phosphoribosyltransferase [Winogradskyella sp.]|nr:uracil phosphoribosyltransferase [Winogradskyella sp.]MBT8376436.1 uracil phosphoribosyltransferase [Bacteroidia bacterium]NNC44954.1 uracil phosphoribosyltransferase [Winogradskyella sp.]NNF85475.1 uracil phosphoribosyltransferase [Winogradskyella sp.]NNK39338.1 uracil phosphoribosyltransferase [Winogradskyella sp.]